ILNSRLAERVRQCPLSHAAVPYYRVRLASARPFDAGKRKRMNKLAILLASCLLMGQLLAQSQAPSAAANPAGGAAYGSQASSQLLPVLAQIEKMAQQT